MTASDFIAELHKRSQVLDLGDGIRLTPIQEKTKPYRWIRYQHLKWTGDLVHYEISFGGYNLYIHLHDERADRECGEVFRRKIKEIADVHSDIVSHSGKIDGWLYEVTMRRPIKCGRGSWEGKFEEIQSEIEDALRELYDLYEPLLQVALSIFERSDLDGLMAVKEFVVEKMVTNDEFLQRLCRETMPLSIGDVTLEVLSKDKGRRYCQYHKKRFNGDVHYEVLRVKGGIQVALHDEREDPDDYKLRKHLERLADEHKLMLEEDNCIGISGLPIKCFRDFDSIKADVEVQMKYLYDVFEQSIDNAARAQQNGMEFWDVGHEPIKLHTQSQKIYDAGSTCEEVEMVRKLVKDLLVAEGLSIPSYQRKYCWVRKQIEGLLDSIWNFPWNQQKETQRLHLGTVVLHQTSKGFDVVDGQQRLITLSILYKLAGVRVFDGDLECKYSLLGTTTPDGNVQLHVYWASRIIREWLASHDECKKFWLERMQVDVIVVNGDENVGKAYTFFNAINSAGKKLSDYDLLKAQHLRYLSDNDPKGFLASEWDDFSQEKVKTFGGEEAFLADELMDITLYRLRCWGRNRKISSERHHVFDHYSAYEALAGDLGLVISRNELDAGLGGGRQFFGYIRQFSETYRRFLGKPAVKSLHDFSDAWRHTVILNIIRALLFFYYCKFGDVCLDDALLFITERIGRIRAENTRIVADRILQQSQIPPHTIEALDESPSPEYFFHYCIMPTNRYAYTGNDDKKPWHIKPAFWNAKKELYKKVESRLSYTEELGRIYNVK